MIRTVSLVLCICFLLFLQVFLHSPYGMLRFSPDLVPIAIAIAVMNWGRGGAAAVGFLAGIVEDSFSTSFLGLGSFSWILAGTIGGSSRGFLYGNRLTGATAIVDIIKMIHEIAYDPVYLWESPGDMIAQILLHAPFEVFYSVILSLVFFGLAGRWTLE